MLNAKIENEGLRIPSSNPDWLR